eukprot:s1270_g8.t1
MCSAPFPGTFGDKAPDGCGCSHPDQTEAVGRPSQGNRQGIKGYFQRQQLVTDATTAAADPMEAFAQRLMVHAQAPQRR